MFLTFNIEFISIVKQGSSMFSLVLRTREIKKKNSFPLMK